MTNDVIRELERYGQQAESTAPALSLEEIVARPGVGGGQPFIRQPLPVSRARRGFLVAVGAAVLTAALIGGVSLLGLFASNQPVADSTPATVLAPDEPDDFTTLAPAPVELLSWGSILDVGLDVPGRVRGLAPTVAGWTAVGSTIDNVGNQTPAVWTSVDGLEWLLVKSAAFADTLGVANGVADHSGRIVVVGTDTESGLTAIWHSDGGVTWNRVSSDDGVLSLEGAAISAVIAPFNAGYVAVGTHAWTSGNGKEWSRSELPGGTAFALMEFDSGLLAGGEAASTGQAAVWFSEDIGNTWVQLEVESRSDLFESSVINSIVETDDGFVAVGGVVSEGVARPAAWRSPDGVRWDIVWASGVEAAGSFSSVAYSAGETVAVGVDPFPRSTGTVWQSADFGSTWVEYIDRSGLFASSLESPGAGIHTIQPTDGGVFVAAGERDGSPAVWVGGPAEEPEEVEANGQSQPGWTCQARIDNGAVWSLGQWDETAGSYTATGPVACLDLLEIHTEPQQWKVVWEGSAITLEVGLKIVFEQGIHGTVYAETEVATESGEWVTPVLTPDSGLPFTFVVMPHSFDTWDEITFTVTPCSASQCG